MQIKLARGGLARRRPLTLEERRARALIAVALLLGFGGIVFAATGAWRLNRPVHIGPGPFGNGTPSLLLAGGGGMALAGLAFAAVALARARWFWRGLEWSLFASAILCLTLGVVRYDPRRAPWLAALACLAMALSGLVHRRRRRAFRPTQSSTWRESSKLIQDDDDPLHSL